MASFNIRTSRGRDGRNRWWRRRESCLAAIRGLSADIVGLQEVRPTQLADLERAFPDARIVGAGRDRGGGGEHASVLVRNQAWTVESNETRWLSPTPDRPGSRGWDAGLTRVVTLARLRSGTTRLGVANAHFDQGPLSRQQSAMLIVDWLAREADRPWIVLGDLNSIPNSRPLRVFTGAGYVDPFPADAGGTEHAFTGATDRKRIDYVLAGPGVSVIDARISYHCPYGRLPSDHWPVVADILVD